MSSHGEKVVLVFEVYDRIKRRGRIDQAIIDFSTKTVEIKSLIEEGFHLSYPCPIYRNGNIYIYPESSQQGMQLLYKLSQGEKFYYAEKVESFNQRMVDATFLPSNDQNNDSIYFYTGIGNDDGLLISGSINFTVNHRVNYGQMSVVGDFRPAGYLPGVVQPFQSANGYYGAGLIFLDISNGFQPLADDDHRLSKYKKFIPEFKFSHHVNQLEDYFCCDTKIKPRFSVITTYKFID